MSELKVFADDKINIDSKIKIYLGKNGEHCEKGRKWWLPAFSHLLTTFLEGTFPGVIKCQDCEAKI